MYKYMLKIIIFVWIVAVPTLAPGRDNSGNINLDKIADDLKYENSVRFIKLNRHDRAIEELNEYLEIFIHGTHRNEAFKNIAEIYFNRFEYQKALKVYRSLFEEFSNSEEGIEAYYNIGICYSKMGYNKKAEEIFKSIITDYSGSGFAYSAQIQIDLLKIIN